MIYSCPHCGTKLVLQSIHLEQEIQCPECGKNFTPEKIPPVEVFCPEPQPVRFFRVFQVVLYSFISVLILGIFCLAAYFAARHMFPEYFSRMESDSEQVIRQKNHEMMEERIQKLETSEKPVQVVSEKFTVSDPEKEEIRNKNKDAEEAFLREFQKINEDKK